MTYDLAIAKVAMQIQTEESPKFDNVFVNLGGFHIEMALFSAVGKYVAESGGPHILNEVGVIAKGSIKSFLSGKSYKHSRRCHQLLALPMEILHFTSFHGTKEENKIGEDIQEEIKCIKSKTSLNDHKFSNEAHNVIQEYNSFSEATENGNHGPTAKFWMKYVEMIRLYHTFCRSLRESKFDLYAYCLRKLASYFFSLNHPNYARWLKGTTTTCLKSKIPIPRCTTSSSVGFSLSEELKNHSMDYQST